jgi:murein DD-endopeptidase MepM/ murein hydrolase activator NlpD
MTSRFRVSLGVVVVLSLVFGFLAAPAQAQSREERRLRDTRARLAQVKNELAQTRDRREAQVGALAEAERQLATILEAVTAAELAVQRQEQAVADARRQLEDLRAEAERRRDVVASRAVSLFTGSGAQPIELLLAAGDPAEAIRRSVYLDVLSRSDRRAVESIGITRVAVDAQRLRLVAEEESLQRALAEQQAILADVRELRNERALVVADTDQRLRQLEAQERHLEAESRQIAALARRPSGSAASRSGGAQAAPVVSGGGWTWPARGPVTSEFGRRWGRMHEGIDIGAGSGSPVVAARAGRVSYAGTMGGYGRIVLIDHGGGVVTAYAHLSAISASAGSSVDAGQRIGSVGCSGSCTGPHLHFEVRVGGGARNPRGYLP